MRSIICWASRFGASRLASGYPLHHLRAHCFAVSRYGGSAAIPLAQKSKNKGYFFASFKQ